MENLEAVDFELLKELSAHRLAGPFSVPPFETFHVSPLGIVPKKTPGEYRLIHHLSFPAGASVNDGISSEDSSVHYATIQDAIKFLKSVRKIVFSQKTDIRIIPVHPDDYPLLGFFWKGSFHYEKCMPMGCSSSCKIFETFGTAVEWVARHKLSIPFILHLLDDFLIVAPTESLCHSQLNIFLDMCYYLGIPIAPEKTIGPSQILSFAGIELDSCLMEARLPLDKVEKCIGIISDFLKQKRVTLREVQSLTGLLNFACLVIVPGRAFLRRVIDSTIGVRSPNFSIRLTRSVREDLKVWLSFLSQYNGKSLFLPDVWNNSDKLSLYTDTAGSTGFGAIFGHNWCYGSWPDKWIGKNIAILGFYPFV